MVESAGVPGSHHSKEDGLVGPLLFVQIQRFS